MTNRDNTFKRPVGRHQDFLDAALGSGLNQAMEEGHACGVLEAIDYAESGSYDESFASFIMASSTAPTLAGKQYCESFAQAASNAQSAFETALLNAASETKAGQIAEALWRESSREVSIYLSFLGVYFSERRKHVVAIQYHDRALRINPDYAMAYFSRGNAKVDLRLYDEAIPDLERAAQLFQTQDDLTNYRHALTILNNLKKSKIENHEKFEYSDQQQSKTSADKEVGHSSEMISNAAQYQFFLIELTQQFPKIPENERQELAAGMLYKYLTQHYDDQESQYTDVDREFFKAICFQQGFDLEKFASKKRSRKFFLMGLVIGGLIAYAIFKLL